MNGKSQHNNGHSTARNALIALCAVFAMFVMLWKLLEKAEAIQRKIDETALTVPQVVRSTLFEIYMKEKQTS